MAPLNAMHANIFLSNSFAENALYAELSGAQQGRAPSQVRPRPRPRSRPCSLPSSSRLQHVLRLTKPSWSVLQIRLPGSNGKAPSTQQLAQGKEQASGLWAVAGLPRERTDTSITVGDTEAESQNNLNTELEMLQTSRQSVNREVTGNESAVPEVGPTPPIRPENGNGETGEEETDFELEKGYKMSRICDRLIEVFTIEWPKPDDWRKLLAFSEEWSKIRNHFFKRCQIRAQSESDPKRRADLLQLARRLKEVDKDMMRHNQLLADVEENSLDLNTVVARCRKDFTSDFFQHLQLLCESTNNNLERQDKLARLAAKCLAAVEAYDRVAEDTEALNAAQLKFDDILNSPSLDAACNKIDELAKRKQLDSTLMLLITKAWAAAKESNMMKEEVKDIMYHLYMVARGNLQRLVPKEVRIIRHILSIADPSEQFEALTNAFSPGDELEGKDVDQLYTTVDRLHKWIKIVLDSYYLNKQSTLIESARQLMNPMIIRRLEVLKGTLEEHFM
eukprot:c25709_g1_i1 orf=188-1702(-)